MSRYIDADAIAEQIKDLLLPTSLMLNDIAQRKIENAPSIDIVRCKECEEYCDWLDGKICMRLGSYHGNTKPNDFCSYGEREGE